jgi:uncharacterized protein YcfJ
MKQSLQSQTADQVRSRDRCGGSLAGYVARYGVKGEPGCYGDGGEAIYRAGASTGFAGSRIDREHRNVDYAQDSTGAPQAC